MSKNLIGKCIIHIRKGSGNIISHEIDDIREYITVQFKDTQLKFQYPEAFEKFIKFENEQDQQEALKCLFNKQEEKRLAKEKLEQIRKEEELKRLEEQKTRTKIENKKLYIAKQKKHYAEKRQLEPYPTWLVFQGIHWKEESAGQFIYVADTKNDNCIDMPFWTTIKEVKMDDVIIHVHGKNIYAISQAVIPVKEETYEIDNNGYRVECDYIMLDNPLNLDNYREQIIDYHQEYMSPFNKNGKGNQGYLYPLDYDLAQFFIKEIVKTNDIKQNYIKDIINTNI